MSFCSTSLLVEKKLTFPCWTRMNNLHSSFYDIRTDLSVWSKEKFRRENSWSNPGEYLAKESSFSSSYGRMWNLTLCSHHNYLPELTLRLDYHSQTNMDHFYAKKIPLFVILASKESYNDKNTIYRLPSTSC